MSLNEFVLIGTKQGHSLLRISYIRSVSDHEDGTTRVLYGPNDACYPIEVAWSAERIYRAIREVSDAA